MNLFASQTLQGQFDKAVETLSGIEALGPLSIEATLNLRATHLELATGMGDLRLATQIDSDCWPIARLRQTVPSDWYRLARMGYLIAAKRSSEAVQMAVERLNADIPPADRHFLDRLSLATALAHAASGYPALAASSLARAVLGPHGNLPEFIAGAQRACGKVATDSPSAAAEHLARAARIFAYIGHMTGCAESRLYAWGQHSSRSHAAAANVTPSITAFYDKPPQSFGRVDLTSSPPPSAADSAAATIRASAAMVDLMSRPGLAGYELLTLVATSGAAASAVMLARRGEATEMLGWTGGDAPDPALRRASDDWVVFALGREREREVSVVVRPRNQQSARTTLLALQRLVLGGTALHQAAVAESEKSALWPEPLPEQQLGFVAVSESMLELLGVARRVANSNITVLVTGETGTGKELLAQAIHNCSPRAKHRFLPFNCTAVPRDMLDSQLFGYRRGAFTGAHDAFPGVIRSAAGGTLFLDEIGEIGLDVQPKLLRFLESSDVHPLGEPAPIRVDVRIVAATNADLDALVSDGKFREDLYYRLNVVKLTIPPLRERREEIPLLLDHFLERCQKESSKAGIRIGETAAEYLLLYDWPGNVRELANEMRRVVALAESNAVVMPEHLSPRLAATRRTVPAGQRPPTPVELLVRRDQPLTAAVEHVERALIMDALRRHGNVEDAARALGLSRKGLYLKRQRLKIDEV
jgi:DNA-binding NtrC family response regulator